MIDTDILRSLLDEVVAAEAADLKEETALAAEVAVLARSLRRRVPAAWQRMPTEITDEPGHWDGTYGPDEYVVDRHPKRMLLVRSATTTERQTSGGFYHSYEIVTIDTGLAIDGAGTLYAIIESGSAALGQYAARPATCNRDIRRDYRPIATPTLADLRSAADMLRTMHAATTAEDVSAYLTRDDAAVRTAALRNPRITFANLDVASQALHRPSWLAAEVRRVRDRLEAVQHGVTA